MNSLVPALTDLAEMVVILVALILPLTFLSALARRALGAERLRRGLAGGNALAGPLKGAVLGSITPFCSISTIPFLVALLRAGVPITTTTAFLLTSPLIDPVLVGVVGVLFGWEVVCFYLLGVLVSALALAIATRWVRIDRWVRPSYREPVEDRVPAGVGDGAEGASVARAATAQRVATPQHGGPAVPTCGSELPSCHSAPPAEGRGWRAELRPSWIESLGVLRSLALPLGIGLAVALVIAVVVPDTATSFLAGIDPLYAIPIASAVGVALYMNSGTALPVGAALIAAGLAPGVVFALLVGGWGASIAELVMLFGVLRLRAVTAYLGYIFVVAAAGGYLLFLGSVT